MHASAMKVYSALISLCFCLDMGEEYPTNTGSYPALKCGAPEGRSPMDQALRVVGGTEARYGSHPWLVSLKMKGSHFCGAAVLTDSWLMTAAHCFTSTSRNTLAGITAVVGEYDQGSRDEEEQAFLIKNISVHERFHHAAPMSYDIALVELEGHIQLGAHVQPICLPLPEESFTSPASCMMAGWGRVRERGRVAAVLREVRLDLVDQARCKHVLDTVRTSLQYQAAGQPQPAFTVLCAGPERGGKDACQGDSGGPLGCRVQGGGRWAAVGVASWGKGCGRSWGSNRSRPPAHRGSPGVFTDVRLLLPWIRRTLRAGLHSCGVRDGPVADSLGIIRNPALPCHHYSNNEFCTWTIHAPPGYSILLEFHHLDLENDSRCLFDRLTVAVGTHGPVGIYCGRVPLGPVLLNNSQSATLSFSSDVSKTGSGFVIHHRAVMGHLPPVFKSYGMVVVVDDQSIVQSPNYPDDYSNNFTFTWVIYAPQGHVVKLDFTDFDLEESDGCLYDSLVVLGDVAGVDRLAVLCGPRVPPSVLSYDRVMVLQLTTDATLTHRGFRASLAFIHLADLHNEERSDTAAWQPNQTDTQTGKQMHHIAQRELLPDIHVAVSLTHSRDTESVAKLAMETTGAQKQGSLVARVVILHPTDPRYNASSWGCNAALLQLASPLPLNEHAQIMCLQEHHGSQDRLPAQVCIVSGGILLEMGLRCSPGVPEGGLWVAFAGAFERAFERCGICGSSPGRNMWKPQHASCSGFTSLTALRNQIEDQLRGRGHQGEYGAGEQLWGQRF
ncbi:ovochymase-2 [Gadus chalcogrammus]|uniref:ovochymase-2 n=1 Tax=Gadus chalcogrammus TaxID=1042646 RepID=UPI0024C4D461|nr:ovochymase-2 [Gadus chalcogrammus]